MQQRILALSQLKQAPEKGFFLFIVTLKNFVMRKAIKAFMDKYPNVSSAIGDHYLQMVEEAQVNAWAQERGFNSIHDYMVESSREQEYLEMLDDEVKQMEEEHERTGQIINEPDSWSEHLP